MSKSTDAKAEGSINLREPDIAWDWESVGYLPAWHEPLLELMTSYVPRNTRVLEVGAGGSHTLGGLARKLGCESWGVEPDWGGIRATQSLAAMNVSQVTMVRGDGFALPFGDSAFDVVYSLGLIEHFTPSESKALVAEHVRVCRPGGRVIVSVPNLLNFPHTLNKIALGKRYPFDPERSYRPAVLRSLLRGAGLRIVASDGLLPLWGMGLISWGWRVNAALNRLGFSALLDQIKSHRLRAALGYMTFAIGERVA